MVIEICDLLGSRISNIRKIPVIKIAVFLSCSCLFMYFGECSHFDVGRFFSPVCRYLRSSQETVQDSAAWRWSCDRKWRADTHSACLFAHKYPVPPSLVLQQTSLNHSAPLWSHLSGRYPWTIGLLMRGQRGELRPIASAQKINKWIHNYPAQSVRFHGNISPLESFSTFFSILFFFTVCIKAKGLPLDRLYVCIYH